MKLVMTLLSLKNVSGHHCPSAVTALPIYILNNGIVKLAF
jgi:hypothetical protein